MENLLMEAAAIDIRKIKYDKGTNVFNRKELDGETTVVGEVKKKPMINLINIKFLLRLITQVQCIQLILK